jgi:hypothetical protein
MRRLVVLLVLMAAAVALLRSLGARARQAPQRAGAASDPRAEELRRKLAESRNLVDERERFEAGETTVDAAVAPPPGPDDRRRLVHEAGRTAAEHMRAAPRST